MKETVSVVLTLPGKLAIIAARSRSLVSGSFQSIGIMTAIELRKAHSKD